MSKVSGARPANGGVESAFADYLKEQAYVYTFWKGRVALYAILKALGIGPGDEVVTPGFTCVVVPNAVRALGAQPIYVDIPADSYNVAPEAALAAITPRTKAILVQHTFGIPAEVLPIMPEAEARGIAVVEDCAHVLGTWVNGRHLGMEGHASFFSSQWSKPFTTGMGGIAVTRSAALAEKLGQVYAETVTPPARARWQLWGQYQLYRRFFSPQLYWLAQSMLQGLSHLGLFVGSSSDDELEGGRPADHEWRMADGQRYEAARQLAAARGNLAQREQLTGLYDQLLSRAGWPIAARPAGTAVLRYPVRVDNKEALLALARQQRIELGSWFETPLHPVLLENHARFGYTLGQCPNAEKAASQVVNLPLHAKVSPAEAERIGKFFLQHARQPA